MRHRRIPGSQGSQQTVARTAMVSRPPRSVRTHVRRTAALLVVLLALAGCDSALDRPSGPTGSAAATTAPTTTTVAITPVTPDGLLSGPGVTDDSITLGMLVDPDRDRGFTAGVELWQQAVNTSGGLCGRSLELIRNGSTDVPTDVVQAYDTIGRGVVGLITLAPPTEAVALNSRISADQIPALTPAGTAAQLGPSRPVVIGPTQDILSINALDYLERSGRVEEGATIGVLTDGSAVQTTLWPEPPGGPTNAASPSRSDGHPGRRFDGGGRLRAAHRLGSGDPCPGPHRCDDHGRARCRHAGRPDGGDHDRQLQPDLVVVGGTRCGDRRSRPGQHRGTRLRLGLPGRCRGRVAGRRRRTGRSGRATVRRVRHRAELGATAHPGLR